MGQNGKMPLHRMNELEGLDEDDPLRKRQRDTLGGHDIYRHPVNSRVTSVQRKNWPFRHMEPGDVTIIREDFDAARMALKSYRRARPERAYEIVTCYNTIPRGSTQRKLKWLEVERTK